MRKVRIHPGKVGIVFKEHGFVRILNEGKHRLSFREWVQEKNLSEPFSSPWPLDIMLRNEELTKHLHVVDVQDNELVIRYENGKLIEVLQPGKYAYWKGLIDYRFVPVDLSKVEITEDIDLVSARKAALFAYIRVAKIDSHERGVLYVDKKLVKELGPGEYFFWKNAQEVNVTKVDIRTQQLEVAGQEILTKDKAALRVNFQAHYRVTDVQKAVVDAKDYEKQLYTLFQLALREYIGTLTLDELLDSKEEISSFVKNTVLKEAEQLGVNIGTCGVRDIILPGEVKEIMNQVLVAQKKAQANVITRREETASTRSLLNTAKLMEDNDILFKLKEMEYIEKIAEKIGEITVTGNGKVLTQLREIFDTRS